MAKNKDVVLWVSISAGLLWLLYRGNTKERARPHQRRSFVELRDQYGNLH